MSEDMTAAPTLDSNKMQGLFDLPGDCLVSSLALTPDGCYIFAAFGGGEVRLYAQALRTVGAAKRNGTIVAHIKSKGMFSNTKVECHVEASEDGRFVFAGLLRGSLEMLAFDITDLPRWGTLPTKEEISLVSGRFDLNKCIRTYAHSDVKLKGFGAAAAMRTGKEYRLFCGRGIKNIHIWSFKPEGPGEWSCLYDTNTNGSTVELVAFRNGGLEGISKSNDANIRVWDLSNEELPTKPRFQDISNSKDTRVVFGDFAYGGTTALSLVKLDAQAVANRMEIALPDAGVASPLAARGSPLTGRGSPLAGRMSPSARGKRHCRMLKDLAGTQDGRHVVLVCSDGMILYHRHTQAVNTTHLEPLEGLGFDEDDARPTVALSLAGKAGLPVLMVTRVKVRGDALANDGEEESQRKLELMVLPRSDAQQFEDSRVPRRYSLGQSLLPWPEGRRLTPEDVETDVDNDYDDDDAGGDAEGSGEEREKEAARRDPTCGGQRETSVASFKRVEGNMSALGAPTSPATPVALQTPQGRYASVAAATSTSTSTFGLHHFDSKPESSSFLPRSPMSPSLSPSVTDPQSRFFTPGPSERRRVRDDGGKTAVATAAAVPGSSPPARSPVGPSPGSSGSRGRRKKRGGASSSGVSRPPAGSSPVEAGVTDDAAASSNVERRVAVAGSSGVQGGTVEQDVSGEKDAGSGDQIVQEEVVAVGGKINEGRADDLHDDDDGGGETINDDGEKDVGTPVDAPGTIEVVSKDHSRGADVESTSEDGSTAGGGKGGGAGGLERRRKGNISGAATGRGASVGRRPGKKRMREDHEKSTGDESGLEEGEHAVAAPMKRGRRGAASVGEDGGHSLRWAGVKGRRTNADDDGGGEQVLLRDRRSRLAARALRSSGNLHGIAAIAREKIASWMTRPEQPEELRVVYITERDGEVDAPATPSTLVKFLDERDKRRHREDEPISLEQARAQHNAGLKLLPHSLSTPTAAVEGKEEDEGDGEAGKGIETDKNRRGLSPLLSYHAAEDEVFGRRDTAVVAPGQSFREEDERRVVWEGHGGTTPKFDSSADTSAGPEGSKISRQGGLRDVDALKGGGSTGEVRKVALALAGEQRGVGPFGTKEAGSNVVNGENAAPIAGSDISTIGRKDDRICHAAAALDEQDKNTAAGNEKHDAPVSRASGPPIPEQSSHMSAGGGVVTSGVHKSSKRGAKITAEAVRGRAAVAVVASGPSIFPPPLESVIKMGKGEGERGSGSEAIDRLYAEHCLEREVVARVFFDEQDAFRRRFLAAVDLVELDKAVECAGLELRNGCRAAQTLKSRLKIRWREATVLPGGSSRPTGREAHQATLRWQEQIRVVIAEHKDLLGDILGRQELEAGALQIAQEMEVAKGKAPKLEVRFAFPGIFNEVAQRHGIKL